MLPWEILLLDPLKSLKTCILLFILHLQSFQGGQPSYMKRSTLPRVFEKWGVARAPCVPRFLRPWGMLGLKRGILLELLRIGSWALHMLEIIQSTAVHVFVSAFMIICILLILSIYLRNTLQLQIHKRKE